MGKLAQIILKKFGYQRAMQMAKKFGLTGNDVRTAAMETARREGRGRLGSAYHASPLERGTIPGGLSKYFQGKPTQTFAQRKAARAKLPEGAQEGLSMMRPRGAPQVSGDVLAKARAMRPQGGHSGIDSLISKDTTSQILERLRGRISPEQLKKLSLLLGGGAAGYGISEARGR